MPNRQVFTSPKTSGNVATVDERRRRPRLTSECVGYVLCGDNESGVSEVEPWEVRVHDVSRLGVGFVAAQRMTPGTLCRMRIGYGPMRLARRMRVTRCEPQTENTFRIGAAFA